MFFKIKKGSVIRGNSSSGGAKQFSSNDPENNIIESDEDLATQEPERYEVYTGHLTTEMREKAGFSNNPSQDVDIDKLSPEQLEDESQRMLERSADLKRIAAVKREEETQKQEEDKTNPAPKGRPVVGQESKVSPSLQRMMKNPPRSEQEYKSMVDKLSISDLRTHAKERGVDLTGLTTREQMADKIKNTKLEDDKE